MSMRETIEDWRIKYDVVKIYLLLIADHDTSYACISYHF